ncbi:hypothetical protein FVE67_05810 [Thermosulfurimonas marina]|uniref:Uncharacterized protein n=1 Tax=Thermosulfurimonas marina TaxID=2047767 RepID=A0A6H1WT52_9BACT|nr:hypothetical protein [Thermosulfurimonas marina]QJA06351.1 hypothetical protein FVE67_05810 [Thermosulfurimonas marina]
MKSRDFLLKLALVVVAGWIFQALLKETIEGEVLLGGVIAFVLCFLCGLYCWHKHFEEREGLNG